MANEDRHRFVFDVNTLVSGFLFPELLPGRALSFVIDHHVLLMSLPVATELTEVLGRGKFDRYLSRQRREELSVELIQASEFVDVGVSLEACRDPSDNKLLELAVAGHAAAIVTGDIDLIALHPFQNVSILKPRDFLSLFVDR